MTSSVPCSPEIPCNRHRVCDYCAARRQRYIAELTASRYHGAALTFATITHLHGQAITQARKLQPGMGGLWSIEAGSKMGGMHVNLLIEAQAPLFASDLAERAAIPGAEVWSKEILPADLRNIAAYINKRTGMPHKLDYHGNLYGLWGSWRSVRTIAQNQLHAPIIAAASVERDLHSLGLQPPQNQRGNAAPPPTGKNGTLSRDDYKALAVDNLPALRKLLGL